MSDEDALLAAIYANHDEDTPRLVYADWLDENGQSERAEFIRLHILLARDPGYDVVGWPEINRGKELESNLRKTLLPDLDEDGRKRVRLWFHHGMLERLVIEHGIPDDCRGLRALSGVREVCITDSALTEEAVRDIATFEQLDELSIWRAPFQAEWLELLDSLPPWTAVEIDSSESGFAQAWVAFQLRRAARVPQAPEERLRQMLRKRLGEEWQYREYLPPGPILRGMLRRASEFELAALSRISELERIILADGNESETGLRYVLAMPNLRSVELYRTDARSLAPLTACTQLERLHITTDEAVLPADGLEGFERLTRLQDVLLNGGPGALRDGTFRRLAPLKQLRSLDLRFGELKEASFSVLAGLPKLEILKLDGPTHDEDVRHLAGLTNLTCLVLTESCVTDAALGHLTRLTKLRTLFVRGEQSQVTQVAARQLARRLPNVTILLNDCVTKSPAQTITFQRREVCPAASILCPGAWGQIGYRKGYKGVWLQEEGWEHIDSRADDRAATLICNPLGSASNKLAKEDIEEYAKRDFHTDPQVLERAVVPFALPDAASCVFRDGEQQEVYCKVNLPDDCVTIIGRVSTARFEELRLLFLFIARSLRVGVVAREGVGEEVVVPVSEL